MKRSANRRFAKPGWLQAPACEPSQTGKWIQKAALCSPRSGARTQPARQQGVNNIIPKGQTHVHANKTAGLKEKAKTVNEKGNK